MRLFLLTLFCLTLFALNSILCRAALITWGMEPLQYTAVRSLSAAAMLAFLCMSRVIKPQEGAGSIWTQVWKQSSWTGGMCLFMYMLSFSLAYVSIPSAAGTLILNISVQFGMVGWGIYQGLNPNRRQVSGLFNGGSGSDAHINAHLVGNYRRHCCLTKSRRSGKKNMVKRFSAHFCSLNKHA